MLTETFLLYLVTGTACITTVCLVEDERQRVRSEIQKKIE
jgi:hypothetical protein